jgi:hypothetical protein
LCHSQAVDRPANGNGVRRALVLPDELTTRGAVLAAASLLILVQAGFRAWALYPSWFFTDDFRLLYDAQHASMSIAYLVRPFDSQFMPVGRFVAWVVAESGPVNWPLAASITMGLQVLASATCLWMLVTLFGGRPGILAPLAIYLFSAVTVPAMMWWAASLNQLPLQVVMFGSCALTVKYLRSRRLSTLALTVVVLLVGLLAYVKTLLVLGVLAFLALAYFSEGSLRRRVAIAARMYWPAVAATVALGAGFVAYYILSVPQPFEASTERKFVELADSMIGTAFVTGAVGGPWSWWDTNAPLVLAGPPSMAVHLAWAGAAIVIVYGHLRRERTLRAWTLLGSYLLALLALLMTSRGVLYGGLAGLDYRYLTDAVPVLTLVLGLVFLPLQGSVQSSAARDAPFLTISAPTWITSLLILGVTVGGLVSTYAYVGYWHRDNKASEFLQRTGADLESSRNVVHLADRPLPGRVMPDYTKPYNSVARIVTLLPGRATFPPVSPRLSVVGDNGGVYRASIEAGLTSEPGPEPGCGWRIEDDGGVVPLAGTAFEWTWWVRVGYLASSSSAVTVTTGETSVDTRITKGTHSLFLKVQGTFDEIEIDGLDQGAVMCVDVIEVGQPVAGAS